MPLRSKIIIVHAGLPLATKDEVLTSPWAALCDMAVLTAFQKLIAS